MAGLTPGKIALLAFSLVAMGGSLIWVLTRDAGVNLANRIVLIDVQSGEMFYVPYGKGRGQRAPVIPEINPDTGEETLFPVQRDESGDGWIIVDRYRLDILEEIADGSVLTDFGSGTVVPISTSQRKLW